MRASRGMVVVLSLGLLAGSARLRAETLVYEGELFAGGAAVSGRYDFRFHLYRAPEGERLDRLGDSVERTAVEVVRGAFAVELDFGEGLPGPEPAWLAIDVRPSDASLDYRRLEPLERLESLEPEVPEDNFPSGTVAYFDLVSCPSGWTAVVEARGRALVGLVPGGTLMGAVGTPLGNLGIPPHQHYLSAGVQTSFSGGHNHQWSEIVNVSGDIQWRTWNSSGTKVLAYVWGNGIGNEGSGIYPFAADWNNYYYTTRSSNHAHDVQIESWSGTGYGNLPYLQLLVCRKD